METKAEILRVMSDNILDQNDDNSLAALMSPFDLSSEEGLDGRLEKVSAIYDIYGIDSDHIGKSVSHNHLTKSSETC